MSGMSSRTICHGVTDGQVARAGDVSVTYVAYYHDLEVMSSNPSRVDLGVSGTSVLSRT